LEKATLGKIIVASLLSLIAFWVSRYKLLFYTLNL